MLKKLRVSNLAIVEQAEVEFDPGLNVITGETGSGKSVLMGALDLVLGGRADSDQVRDGAKEAEVEADFGEVVVRRTVTSAGRTRAWVNDESVSIAELKDLGRTLIDIHGPRANQALLEESFQRTALDGCGVPVKVRKSYAEAFAAWSDIRKEIDALEASAHGDISAEMDMLKYQVNELEAAKLTEDDENIAERHAAAAHAGEVLAEASAVTEGLGGEQGAAEILAALHPHFAALSRQLPAAADWAAQAEELTVSIQELSRTVADGVSRIEVGEEDLDALDERLTTVNRLKRKYSAALVADLLQTLAKKQARLAELEGRDARLAELNGKLMSATAVVKKTGAELSAARKAAAEKFGKSVTGALRDLGFLQAKFFVTLEAIEPDASGCDRVVFMFEPNPGESARPLADIASSGEIARVMLALKTTTTRADEGDGARRTLVFDEIDANIGGEVGKVVGQKMRTVAKGHQVIAITHLPQSAVFGERHIVVSKSVSGGRTRTHVTTVTGEDRIAEVARMLGGKGTGGVVLEHARELLKMVAHQKGK